MKASECWNRYYVTKCLDVSLITCEIKWKGEDKIKLKQRQRQGWSSSKGYKVAKTAQEIGVRQVIRLVTDVARVRDFEA